MIEHIAPLTAVALISITWATWATLVLTDRHRARAFNRRMEYLDRLARRMDDR